MTTNLLCLMFNALFPFWELGVKLQAAALIQCLKKKNEEAFELCAETDGLIPPNHELFCRTINSTSLQLSCLTTYLSSDCDL
jgi:hypothetical protein